MATAKQIAARKRFAEMARSGELARMRKKATRVSNPASKQLKMKIRGSETPDNPEGIVVTEAGALKFAKQNMPNDLKRAGFVPSVVAGARGWSINYGMKVKNNPAKTVSEEISRQVRKGKPQKQAVAIALEMEREGKVKKNPMSLVAETIYRQLGANKFVAMTGAKNFVYGDKYLMFSIPRNASPFNSVQIEYIPGKDTYDVNFMKVTRAGGVAKSDPYNDVYAEQLQELFRMVTGLETSLGTMGRRSNPTATRAPARSRTKLISNGRENNPVTKDVFFANVVDDGGFEFGMDDRTPVTFKFSNREMKRGVYRSFALPHVVTTNPMFQAFVRTLPQATIIVSLKKLKEMLRQYI